MDLDAYSYPQGLTLLQRWQAGEAAAKTEIKDVFESKSSNEIDYFLPYLAFNINPNNG